jgi:hypothetical protein
MMGRFIQFCVYLALALTVAACGSSGGAGNGNGSGGDGGGGDDGGGGGVVDPPPPDPLNIVDAAGRDYFLNIFRPDWQAVAGMARNDGVTPFDDLPVVSGTTNYAGYMTLFAASPRAGVNLLGETTLSADFMSGTISGSAGSFYETITVRDGIAIPMEVVLYTGSLAITAGAIGGSGATNTVDFSAGGTLNDGIKDVTVNAQLTGAFFGTGAEGLHAIAGTSSGGSITATIDGQAAVLASATVDALME